MDAPSEELPSDAPSRREIRDVNDGPVHEDSMDVDAYLDKFLLGFDQLVIHHRSKSSASMIKIHS